MGTLFSFCPIMFSNNLLSLRAKFTVYYKLFTINKLLDYQEADYYFISPIANNCAQGKTE